MTPKDFIEQLKDYVDVADASYAMLHYIDENEEIDYDLDERKSKNPNENVRPSPKWIYADNNGMPTAYALAIEARFSQNMEIKKPKYDNPSELESILIDNKIRNLIDRRKEDSKATQQQILVATTKSQQDSSKGTLTFHLSPRTKYFTSRFDILHHQPNTSISGYSHTLFKDHLAKDSHDRYILAFRGTELRGAEFFKDAVLTDGSIALGVAIPQIISLVKFKNEVLETIKKI